MDLDSLYHDCRRSGTTGEDALFRHLNDRFRLFAEQKIRNRLDAEEVIQNALAVVAAKFREIDIQTSFAAWAHKVLSNEILKYYRSKGYQERLFMQMTDSTESGLWMPDPDLKRRLLDCIRKMCVKHVRYARVLNLSFQGYKAAEISQRLSINPDSLYVILSRARSLLKLCLDSGDIV